MAHLAGDRCPAPDGYELAGWSLAPGPAIARHLPLLAVGGLIADENGRIGQEVGDYLIVLGKRRDVIVTGQFDDFHGFPAR